MEIKTYRMAYLKTIMQALLIMGMAACSGNNKKSDAYGNFEAVDVLVASEMQGRLISFNIEEGKTVKAGEITGLVDTVQLSLKLEQLYAQRKLVSTKYQGVSSQIAVQEEQKRTLLIEKKRIENLLNDKAVPQKQMDDIKGKLDVLESQIASIKTQNSSIANEIEMIDKQIDQVIDQIKRCKIINPIDGTVLDKYIENQEIVTPGKNLYKIANLQKLILRVYISGTQLEQIKTGKPVKVYIDKSRKDLKELPGTITWISPQAEFTPKIIQTKEERVNLVYAVKIEVPNDGSLKIGMPGEVQF